MTNDRLQKGQVLKQAREQKGISLDSIHEATKIPLDALKAIEAFRVFTHLLEVYRWTRRKKCQNGK